MRRLIACLLLGMGTPAAAQDAVVSVGGPITEIIYALGQGDHLVARDTTSVYPAAALDLPDVGYMRRLSAEGVLSVGPDLIIARDTSGPPEVLDQLKAAAIPVVLVHDGFSGDAILRAIDTIGTALNADETAADLSAKVSAELDNLALETSAIDEPKSVLFVLSADAGRLNVAGADTGADGLISLAGGVNAMAEAFSGYKLLNTEALLAANPDVILIMKRQGAASEHDLSAQTLLAHPGIAPTNAGEHQAVITVDSAALGFGPRTPEMAKGLFQALYEGGS